MQTYTDLIEAKTRFAGVLLHPTSLPSGKLDADAFRWLDFMQEAGLSVWQVLPLGVPQTNLSPYQCYSAFAMNPALLTEEEYADINLAREDFQQWFKQQAYWLEDYAVFMALKQNFSQQAWNDWPNDFKDRNPQSLWTFRTTHQAEIDIIYWQQFCLYIRWHEIRKYAHERQILLFGDMPIFVAHDSADVWVHRQSFLLDETGNPSVVAGVPPDYFSETGQRWGNPHYNWEFMLQNDFEWWLNRLQNHLAAFDVVRIDHFRGLEAAWFINATCETAVDGEWRKIPGEKLLSHLQQDMGNIPIVAEDLGIITPEVDAMRKHFQLPGMAVLQFAFDSFADNPHKPENITYDRVVYTGTHDNDTSCGWFAAMDDETRDSVMQALAINETELFIQTMIDTALRTEGQLTVIPFQDFLALGSEARMNIPGISDDNWTWQFNWHDLPVGLAERIRHSIENAGRLIPTLQEVVA